MSGSAHRSALVIGAALSAVALLAVPAIAKGDADDIAVNPPVVQIAPGRGAGDVPSGRPVEELSVSRAVQTDDLNLNTRAGVNELERRIHASAVASCRQIDSATADVLIDGEFACVRQAMREARLQVDDAPRG